ncbi:HAD family hydrolase [Bifidobacterium bifidum]|nr:HAD family hydrolase [Bifidobacterium bifidum]
MPTATVHAWNDTGWRHDGAHARLIAFDLDNTLAVSKQPMKPDMTVRIEALTELMPVAIVTGGGRELVISQVLDVLGPRADLSNLHVMPAGGSSYYRWREGAWRLEYERTLSARDRDAAILSLTRRARELGMWPEHPWGSPSRIVAARSRSRLWVSSRRSRRSAAGIPTTPKSAGSSPRWRATSVICAYARAATQVSM